MAKKKETWSFIEQPRLFRGPGIIHNEFVTGRKSDYVIQLGTANALGLKSSAPLEMTAAVHLPLGCLGSAVFERAEPAELERATNKVLQGVLWFWLYKERPQCSAAYMHQKDDRLIAGIQTRSRRLYQIKSPKPIRDDAWTLVKPRLEAWENDTLLLPEEPLIEVPTRPGKMWMWSARWRELHADPKWLDRPSGLDRSGGRWITGISSTHLGSRSY